MTSSVEIQRPEIHYRINRGSAYSRRESLRQPQSKRLSKCSILEWITTLRRVNWLVEYWRLTVHIFHAQIESRLPRLWNFDSTGFFAGAITVPSALKVSPRFVLLSGVKTSITSTST